MNSQNESISNMSFFTAKQQNPIIEDDNRDPYHPNQLRFSLDDPQSHKLKFSAPLLLKN
jgi:hypothetical protein